MITQVTVMLLTQGFIICMSYIDAEHINDEDYIESHISRVIMRTIFCTVLGIIHWQYFFAGLLLIAATFDQSLNYFLKKPIWHLGNTAEWDKLFSKHKWLYFVTKVIALLSSLFLFLYLLT